MSTNDDKKKCSRCGKRKLLSLFPKRSNRASGRQPHCKTCHRANMAAYRAAKKVGAKPVAQRTTGVYIWTRADGAPFYVGITSDLATRTADHLRHNSEWSQYAIAPVDLFVSFPSRPEALAAEEAMIKLFVSQGYDLVNKTHNEKNSPEHYTAAVSAAKTLRAYLRLK